ncbi:hypothetical protein [Streptomyces meridianus]
MRRLGVVSDDEGRAVRAARERAVAMLEMRAGPFADAGAWAAWPPPRLPR